MNAQKIYMIATSLLTVSTLLALITVHASRDTPIMAVCV